MRTYSVWCRSYFSSHPQVRSISFKKWQKFGHHNIFQKKRTHRWARWAEGSKNQANSRDAVKAAKFTGLTSPSVGVTSFQQSRKNFALKSKFFPPKPAKAGRLHPANNNAIFLFASSKFFSSSLYPVKFSLSVNSLSFRCCHRFHFLASDYVLICWYDMSKFSSRIIVCLPMIATITFFFTFASEMLDLVVASGPIFLSRVRNPFAFQCIYVTFFSQE